MNRTEFNPGQHKYYSSLSAVLCIHMVSFSFLCIYPFSFSFSNRVIVSNSLNHKRFHSHLAWNIILFLNANTMLRMTGLTNISFKFFFFFFFFSYSALCLSSNRKRKFQSFNMIAIIWNGLNIPHQKLSMNLQITLAKRLNFNKRKK